MKQLALAVARAGSRVFANFHAGENAEALARCQQLAGGERLALWLWGPPGCGRSHLLQATAAAGGESATLIRGSDPDMLPGPLAGRTRLVIVDDIDARVGDARFERWLFTAYRELEDAAGGLLVSAEAPPRGLRWGLADLASRMSASQVLRLRPLDDRGRAAALKLHAGHRGFALPDETLDYLLARLPRDLPSLFELLDTLDSASLEMQRRITVPFIREVLHRRGHEV
ncbi:MAG: DnaA regulatory inactivator Hda [Steroidobacteraceae bacterium]